MKKSIFVEAILVAVLFSACGRYAAPKPPEYFSPRSVNELKAEASLDGVLLTWKAPDNDLRGEPLKSMDGYFIKRRVITSPSDILDDDIEDELLATIEDNHIKVLKELRDKAIEEGRISRKVTVDEELKKFSYLDTTAKAGVTYIYRVVPFNQGDVEGLVPQLVKVAYLGDNSFVSIIETDDMDVEPIKDESSKRWGR